MDSRSTGLLIMIIGAVVVVVGVLVMTGTLSWFGRLPGDIRYQGQHTRVYIPITSMIILSVLLSLVLWLFRR
jgi:membrane protein implicated in regulation of membrane protease activity